MPKRKPISAGVQVAGGVTVRLSGVAVTVAPSLASSVCIAAWKACMGTPKGKSFNDAEQRAIDEWRKAGSAALSVFKSPPTLPKLPARGSSALGIGPGGPPAKPAAVASSLPSQFYPAQANTGGLPPGWVDDYTVPPQGPSAP